MKLDEAMRRSHARSSLYRASHPDQRFVKHHPRYRFVDRIPAGWESADDWQEYDPREDAPTYEMLA